MKKVKGHSQRSLKLTHIIILAYRNYKYYIAKTITYSSKNYKHCSDEEERNHINTCIAALATEGTLQCVTVIA